MALYEFNPNIQTLATGQEIIFVDDLRYGCTVTHCGGSGDAKIHRPGIYMVEFNATASGAAGDITVQARKDGVFVESALSTASTTGLTDFVALEFMFLVKVCCKCDCEIIDFINTGDNATFTNTACTITKVC